MLMTHTRPCVQYTLPSVAVEDLVAGTYVSRTVYNTTSRLVNLPNGIIEFVAHTVHVNSLPLSQASLSLPEVFWPMFNIPSLVQACNASMFLSNTFTNSKTSIISASNTAILYISLGLFAIVVLAFMIPAALRAIRTQTKIFDVFLEVCWRVGWVSCK